MRMSLSPRPLAKITGLLAVLAIAGFLASCYFPVRFDAEIEINRAGYYSMIFDGYLADVQLYKDLAQEKLSPAEEKRRVEMVRNDFARDAAVTEFKYYKQGIFKVHWTKKGDLTRYNMVTFFQRNEAMLTLKYIEEKNIIVMSGASMSTSQRQQIADAGLNMTGEVRLITDAKVLSQNATEIRNVAGRAGTKMYIWRITDINSPSPRLVLQPG